MEQGQKSKLKNLKLNNFLVLSVFLLAGCQSMPRIGLTWPESEKDAKIYKLQTDLERANIDLQKAIDEKTQEIVKEETDRISVGTSQVYAAYGTLGADPEPNKYTDAASRALVVAKEALPVPKVEDLLEAVEIQKKLLSEQAVEIEQAKKLLADKSTQIIESKQKVVSLEQEKTKIEQEKEATEQAFSERLEKLSSEREAERLQLLLERDELAQKWKVENSFWKKINPLNGIMKTFSSLFFWIALFVVLGGALKLASVLFPGVSIIQTLIGGIGRVLGAGFGLIFKWIPDALRGMNAVDYKEYEKEKKVADSSVGAIQEFKYENPDLYNQAMKDKLIDWFKDSPELVNVVEKKLKDLNLK